MWPVNKQLTGTSDKERDEEPHPPAEGLVIMYNCGDKKENRKYNGGRFRGHKIIYAQVPHLNCHLYGRKVFSMSV